MITRLSTLFLRTLREDPADAEVPSHKLLVRAGYVRRVAPGVYSWLPLGLRVLRNIEAVVREEMAAIGAQEIQFPALLPREPYEATGRWTEYGANVFRLKDRKGADYLLGPTHEELFTLTVKGEFSSYKDYPVILYQIQTKYRDEERPRAGILRGREFLMKDSYSFDLSDDGLTQSYLRHREAYRRIFDRLGLRYVIVAAMSGAMGGSASEEFLAEAETGEDTFVRCLESGYAANVEAVTTPAPPELPLAGQPAARVLHTPATPTIETLVEHLNGAGLDRTFTAADTLKNVMVKTRQPGAAASGMAQSRATQQGRAQSGSDQSGSDQSGSDQSGSAQWESAQWESAQWESAQWESAQWESAQWELLGVGVPGDREVDLKRLAASLAPAEVSLLDDADFAAYSFLVKGYLGPGALAKHGVRYLVDPRVVRGTAWVTGADRVDHHVINLVCGRDFTPDGTIEAAEVRAGDPAPDGAGALVAARGIEIGHIFQLGRKYTDAFALDALGPDGKPVRITMGSYGIGVSRLVGAIAEQSHDEHGLIWPRAVAPADVHLVVAGKDETVRAASERLAAELDAAGLRVLLDDRPATPGVKFADAELIGVPTILVVGRGLAAGVVEIKDRATGERTEVPVAGAVAHLQELCRKQQISLGRN